MFKGANNPLETATYASKRKDDKYVIPLLDIIHIEVGTSPDAIPDPIVDSNRLKTLQNSQISETRKLSTKINLRGGSGWNTFDQKQVSSPEK